MDRVCLIGPSYPFRGGIPHYTTLLFGALKKRYQTRFFSFTRQYPKWLFPGKNDRDPSRAPIRDEDVEPILDSLNPLTWVKTAAKVNQFAPDLLILPWWIAFWVPQFWTILKCVTRSRTKILFICHNVVSHESRWYYRVGTRLVLKQGDFFVVHSEEERQHLFVLLPGAKVVKAFHPTYEVFHSGISKAEARQRLGVSGDVLLFFGFVRPYKGLMTLLEAMPKILERRPVTLLVVGEFWEDKDRYLQRMADLKLSEHIRIVNEYVPDEDVGFYFAASDLVVLPYVSVTGSGIVQVAFGCERPVVATGVGCLPEVVADGETGYVVPPEDPDSLADAVLRFLEGDREKFIQAIREHFKRFSWEQMVGAIEKISAEDT